jgi:hypothetical protein
MKKSHINLKSPGTSYGIVLSESGENSTLSLIASCLI